MLRPALFACLLLTTPTLAAPVILTIDNRASVAVDRVNTFPVDADGVPIEDNVGSLESPIPPGETATVTLTSDGCEIIHVAVGMADDRELVGMYDICTDRLVVVTDK